MEGTGLVINPSSVLCGTVHNYSSACWRVNEKYPIGISMEIPSWATLILAACLICGETMSLAKNDSSDSTDRDKNYKTPLTYSRDAYSKKSNTTGENERTIKRLNEFSESVNNSYDKSSHKSKSDGKKSHNSDGFSFSHRIISASAEKATVANINDKNISDLVHSDSKSTANKLNDTDTFGESESESNSPNPESANITQKVRNVTTDTGSEGNVSRNHDESERGKKSDIEEDAKAEVHSNSQDVSNETTTPPNRVEAYWDVLFPGSNWISFPHSRKIINSPVSNNLHSTSTTTTTTTTESSGVVTFPVDHNRLEEGQRPNLIIESTTEFGGSIGLKAGRTVNIFSRYGSLTLTLKVMPSKFSNSWLFREKTSEILKRGTYWERRETKDANRGFDEHYLIDFCDTPKDLYAAYFDHFEIEGVPEAHRAFTSFLSSKKKAQFLGIHGAYLNNDGYSFVLVRLFKTHATFTLDGDLDLSDSFKNATERLRVGSAESAHQFMDKFGTHVLVEYSLGDVIYQVFVFGPRTYSELKNTFALSYQELRENHTSEARSNKLLEIREYFSPYLAVHVGEVQMASGHPKFDEIRSHLKKRFYFLRFYESIFQILNNKEVEREVVNVKGRVITGMKLRKVTRAMPPSPQRYWLSVVLDNTLAIYYVTM